jgi:hypothetical protein
MTTAPPTETVIITKLFGATVPAILHATDQGDGEVGQLLPLLADIHPRITVDAILHRPVAELTRAASPAKATWTHLPQLVSVRLWQHVEMLLAEWKLRMEIRRFTPVGVTMVQTMVVMTGAISCPWVVIAPNTRFIQAQRE